MGTTSCPYDCNAGYSNWEKGWPSGKKTYCCQHEHRVCPATPAPAVTTSLPYDCNAGYHNCYHCLIKQWSVGKLALMLAGVAQQQLRLDDNQTSMTKQTSANAWWQDMCIPPSPIFQCDAAC